MKNKVTDRFKAAVNRELLLKEDVLLLVRVVAGFVLINIFINEPEA